MNALELGHGHHAGAVAADERAVHGDLGHGIVAALGNGLGAVGDDLAAFEQFLHERVLLEFAELHVWIDERIVVVEPGDQAEGDLIVRHGVDEAAAKGVAVHGIAHGVDDVTRGQRRFRELPDFLHSRGVGLRIAAFVEAELLHELLGARAARAFAEDGALRQQVGASLENAFGRSVGIHALVAELYADDRFIFVKHFLSRKRGQCVHARGRELLAQPLHQLAQRHDEVAVVVHLRRHQGEFEGALAREEVHALALHLALDGRALGLEVRDQLGQRLGFHDRAGQGVIAQVGGLLDDRDHHVHAQGFLVDGIARLFALGHGGVVLGNEVGQVEGAGEPGGAAADEDDARFHGISLCHVPLLILVCKTPHAASRRRAARACRIQGAQHRRHRLVCSMRFRR